MIIKNKKEFDALFTQFSEAVKEKKYTKLPYQTWNKIKDWLCKMNDDKSVVTIRKCSEDGQLSFYLSGLDSVSDWSITLPWDDCSFGQFINDRMNIKGYASIDLRSVKAPVGIRDKLEKSDWTREYTAKWKADYMPDQSPVDSGEWWGEVDKPLKLTYVGDDLCLKSSDDKCVKVNASSSDSWKDVVIAGDCIQPDGYSISIPGYATVESVSDAIATKADKAEINSIYDIIDEIKQTAGVGLFDNKEGKNDMKNVFNFDFGPVESECIRMSMYGLAVKNIDGVFVSYDAAAGRLVDVDILNFNGNKFLYKMPVAIKDVKVGDIIVHMRRPVFVTDIQKNSIIAVDPHDGEMKTVLLTRSPFGFDFATKVVNFLGDFSAATPDNPFGNMWMFMMMDGDNKDNMLPLMMMMSQGNANMNPMMMYMMMQDKGDMKDVLPFMMMMGQNPFAAPAPIPVPVDPQ